MPELSPPSTTCPTHFKHDLFSNGCADLKTVAKIAIPLIMIIGAIYYLWRYSSQTITPDAELKPSLEQEIEKLIEQKNFAEAESLIKRLPTPVEIARWTDIYHQYLCHNYIEQEFLTHAYAQALKMKSLPMRDPLLIQIFIACLKKEQFSVPWQLLNGLKESDSDNLKEGLIDAAQAAETLALAFCPLSRLSSPSTRKTWLNRLANKIALNHHEISSFMGYAIQSPEKRDPLLEDMIPILIENNLLAAARAFTLLFFNEDKKLHWQQEIRNNHSKNNQ